MSGKPTKSPEQIKRIMRLISEKVPQAKIARGCGLSPGSITYIKNHYGKQYEVTNESN